MLLTLSVSISIVIATDKSIGTQLSDLRVSSNLTGSAKVNVSPKTARMQELMVKSNDVKSQTANRTAFGEQTESSLLRPLLLKGLMSAKQRLTGHLAAASEPAPVEEELVEQTIVVPLSDQQQQQQQQREPNSVASEISLDDVKNLKLTGQLEEAKFKLAAASKNQDAKLAKMSFAGDLSPQPEASMRLTRTELDSLLSDREGPAFYREREQGGQGVTIGEQKLGTASSDRVSGFSAGAYPTSGFPDHPSSYFAQGRLMNSASEELGPSGFQHRFGMADPSAFYGQHDGRLMQSPAHAAEYNELGPMGGSGQEYAPNYGYDAGDYGPSSGMLRAGSASYGPLPMGAFEGPSGGFMPSSGYPGSPVLDRHASEIYGPSSSLDSYAGFGSLGPDYHGQGRLMSAGSQRPDEYGSRFGSIPFDQRGFSSQARLLLEGNSMVSNNKIVPLNPEIPTDEVSSASALSESAERRQPRRPTGEQDRSVQVHEPLEDDPTATGETGSGESNQQDQPSYDDQQQQQQQQQSQYNSRLESQEQQSEYNRLMASRHDGSDDQTGHSVVLNVPPPGAESRAAVEFSHSGSAGYLAPSSRNRLRNSDENPNHLVKKSSRLRSTDDNYDPANNPAHAGKYMID